MHEILNAYWDIISCHIVTLFKILKQMNHSQRRNSVFFLFLVKSCENTDTAFCIVADEMLRLFECFKKQKVSITLNLQRSYLIFLSRNKINPYIPSAPYM